MVSISLNSRATLPVFRTQVRSILSPTSGFIAQAGFTHSLTPARNCTYGCLYCYVPTLGMYGGLQPEDVRRWGQFTTLKENAAALLRKQLRPHHRIYCSPLVDPYQPVEAREQHMPALLASLCDHPPQVFALQTRSPLVVRDVTLLRDLASRCSVRISMSLTTDNEQVRRRYEPHCEPIEQRLEAMQQLQAAGLQMHATLAPILPCNPERLVELALQASNAALIADPLHVRSTKPHGAVTRDAAWQVAERHCERRWWNPAFQGQIVERMRVAAAAQGRTFAVGTEGFSALSQPLPGSKPTDRQESLYPHGT